MTLVAAGLISPMFDPNYFKGTRVMKLMARLSHGDRMIYHLPESLGAVLATCMQNIEGRWVVYFNGPGLCTIKAEPHWAAGTLRRRWARLGHDEPKLLFRDTIKLEPQCSDTLSRCDTFSMVCGAAEDTLPWSNSTWQPL